MHFPVKLRPYVAVFNKVIALLTLWEFDRGIDGEFHNGVIGGSRDLFIIFIFLKRIRK